MTHDPKMKTKMLVELTDAAERGDAYVITTYLQQLDHAEERIDVLKQISEINHQKRYQHGQTPMLMFVHERLDGDSIDFALLKKSSDWLFADKVLYKETAAKKAS